MTFDEFKEFFEEHGDEDEVKELVGTPEALTAESVTEFLKTDAGQPIIDREINRAVKSHDEKRKPEIDKMISDAVDGAKKETTLTAAEQTQKQIDELRTTIKERDADLARRDLILSLRTKAEEMHVPLDIAVDLDNPNLTEDGATARMEAYAQMHKDQIDAEVNRRLVNDSHKPGAGAPPKSGSTDLSTMTQEELIALEEKGELDDIIVQ